MYAILDFIVWALSHAAKSAVLDGAYLPVSLSAVGTEIWHYLFGSVRVKTDANTLEYYYIHHYHKSMTRERYDQLTKDWKNTDFATDCQGLLDAFLTYVCGEKTDINANMNYTNWCTTKGKISEIDRPYVIGEALFEYNGTKMNHVGWVCGFAADGVPLAVEARGIAYGVVVTRMDKRNWTHRGLMTKKFDYTEPTHERAVFEVRSPMSTGMIYEKMQDTLNSAGYTDADGKPLEVDGKWGKLSQQAFDALIADYTPKPVFVEPVKHDVTLSVDGAPVFTINV